MYSNWCRSVGVNAVVIGVISSVVISVSVIITVVIGVVVSAGVVISTGIVIIGVVMGIVVVGIVTGERFFPPPDGKLPRQ